MNPAGQSTRGREKHHYQRRMFALGAILAGGLLFFVLLRSAHSVAGIIVLAVGLVVVMKYLEETGKAEKRTEGKYRRGAIAEESIGELLDKLPGDNLVLHDVPSQFGNIDHIIISRTKGVILVETKSHHGTITVEGDKILVNGNPPEKDFIGQTLGNCYWLKEWVKINAGVGAWINCVIVFTNGFVKVRGKIKGVSVINAKYFSTYYERLPDNNTTALWDRRDKLQGLAGD